MLFRSQFTAKRNPSTYHSSFESADWTLRTNNSRIRIIVIYRPPSSANHPVSISTFISEFSSLLESVFICSEPLIVTGDFNIHMDIQEESTQFTELLETFSKDIVSMVKSAPCKTCEADTIPTTLLKSSIEILGSTLRKLINSSITTGVIYPSWKRAIIQPKLKRQNLELLLPTTDLFPTFPLSRNCLKKATVNQLLDHFTAQDLLPSMQSAYRRHHSTETALLKVKNDLLLNMNRQHVTLLVFLDLSSAFDTVDHAILLNRLESLFGISETALSWFKYYLSDRKQYVSVDRVSSSTMN